MQRGGRNSLLVSPPLIAAIGKHRNEGLALPNIVAWPEQFGAEMSSTEQINRLLKQYHQGVYTLRELVPLLVENTPHDHLKNLQALLPNEIWTAFVKWIRDYPVDDGIQIRDGQSLPVEKIVWLRQAMADEC